MDAYDYIKEKINAMKKIICRSALNLIIVCSPHFLSNLAFIKIRI